MALSEYADLWDEAKQSSEQDLAEWVQDNPQWWAVGIATFLQTSMDVGAGVVDVLRLGEGVAQGGWRGYGKDVLRLLFVLGPVARVGGALSRFVHTQAITLAVETQGVTGPCTFTAVNNALSIVSGRARNLFLTAREAARVLGKSLRQVAKQDSRYKVAAWIDDLVPFLRGLGVRLKVLQPQTVREVAEIVKRETGVAIFSIRYRSVGGEEILHSVIAVRDALGQVRYADYGGKLVGSLEELARRLGYGVPDSAGISLLTKGMGAVVVEGMKLTGLMEDALAVTKGAFLMLEGLTAIESIEEGVELAMPAVPVAVPVPVEEELAAPPEVVKTSFKAFRELKSGRPVLRMPELRITGRVHRPPPAQWLTGVQYRLNAMGFGAGRVDGVLGPRTEKALKGFQKAYGLAVDGIPTPRTQAKLAQLCGY